MMDKKITVRVFLGCPINSELRMHLKASQAWKEAAITQTLIETHHEQKDYIGRFASHSPLTLDEVRAQSQEIKQLLQSYCPKASPTCIHIVTFPQIFIA